MLMREQLNIRLTILHCLTSYLTRGNNIGKGLVHWAELCLTLSSPKLGDKTHGSEF